MSGGGLLRGFCETQNQAMRAMATKATMPPRMPPIWTLDSEPLDRSGGGSRATVGEAAAGGGSAGFPLSEFEVGGPLPRVTYVTKVVLGR